MTIRKRGADRREQPGRFAYDGLERVLHEKARLGIMAALVAHPEGLTFAQVKRLCTLTDGNLSRHLEVLRGAGVVEIWKGFAKRRPQTICRLSPDGRARFHTYLEELERVIEDALPRSVKRLGRAAPPPGFQLA